MQPEHKQAPHIVHTEGHDYIRVNIVKERLSQCEAIAGFLEGTMLEGDYGKAELIRMRDLMGELEKELNGKDE